MRYYVVNQAGEMTGFSSWGIYLGDEAPTEDHLEFASLPDLQSFLSGHPCHQITIYTDQNVDLGSVKTEDLAHWVSTHFGLIEVPVERDLESS